MYAGYVDGPRLYGQEFTDVMINWLWHRQQWLKFLRSVTDQSRRRNSNQGDNYIKNRKDMEEGTRKNQSVTEKGQWTGR